MSNALYAVTVLGRDRPGIVATATRLLADLGANLEDSTMTLLRGHFAMVLLARCGASADEVEAALAPLAGDGSLLVSVREVPDEPVALRSAPVHLLSVHGADRPGIVSAVTSVVAAAGGNITDLSTRLTGPLYVLLAEVELPHGEDAEALSARLGEVAASLGVDVSLRTLDDDLL